MRLSLILGLLAASAAVEASVCKLSQPSSSSSASSSSSPSPSPSTFACNTNQLADQTTGVSYASDWQYAPLEGVTVSFPETCMNNGNDQYPDGSCVNILLTELPTDQGPWTAVTITRTVPTVVGTGYEFGFVYQLGSDEPAANTGLINNIECSVNNAAGNSGWSNFYNGYKLDTNLNFEMQLTASATTTTITCVLTVITDIDMTVGNFYLMTGC
ncbi:hypothetical protein SEUCBS139899_004347 [Sporothrix eucalyptigena]|uniref:Uncharacterized protein n=1 Tax=Sporothrix eucalyptigena TaxID=1812306 RepID=A0ABP0CS56_9PEZI